MKSKAITIPTALKPYLKSSLPGGKWYALPDRASLERFQRRCGPRCRGRNLVERQRVIEYFGKPPAALTLREFREYNRPNAQARIYLKELWHQLTRREQELVIRLNEWAFTFPATFASERDFLLACAGRLGRFFNRTFRVPPEAHQEEAI
jgi:hypothetical protein